MEPWMRRLEEMRVSSSSRKPIPKFDGREAYWWLIQLHQYFEDNKTHEEMKVMWVTMFALSGEALEWWSSWKQRNQKATWKIFEKAVIKKFIPDLWACLQVSEDEEQENKGRDEIQEVKTETHSDSGLEKLLDKHVAKIEVEDEATGAEFGFSQTPTKLPPSKLSAPPPPDPPEPSHERSPHEPPSKPSDSCLHTQCSIAMEFRIFGMTNKLPRPKPPKPLESLSDPQPEPPDAGSSVAVLSEPKPLDPDLVGSSVEILVWSRNDLPLSGTPELPLSITARAAGAAINKRGWLGLRLHSLLEKGEADGFGNEQRRKDRAAEEELREMGQFVDLMGQAQFLEKKKPAAQKEEMGLLSLSKVNLVIIHDWSSVLYIGLISSVPTSNGFKNVWFKNHATILCFWAKNITQNRAYDPGGSSHVSCTVQSFCFKLWDPGGIYFSPVHFFHLEDKVNFKGGVLLGPLLIIGPLLM